MNRFHLNILILITGASLTACTSSLYIETAPQININESANESMIINEIIEPYRKELAKKMDVNIALSEVNFIVKRPSSNLMNWMSDAVFTNQTKNKRITDPTFCLLNTGGIRSSIGIGKITLGDIYKLMPFDNSIVWVKLPIAVLDTIETYLANTGGEPISNIEVINNEIILNGFDRQHVSHFWVITSDYLFNGGDHMDFFQQNIETIETNKLIRDALIEEATIQGTLMNDEIKRIK